MPVQCEICRSRLHSDDAAGRIHIDRVILYFCCEACRRAFREHPDMFPVSAGTARSSRPGGAVRSA